MDKADADVVLPRLNSNGGYLMPWLRVGWMSINIDNKCLAVTVIEIEVYQLVMMLSASGG